MERPQLERLGVGGALMERPLVERKVVEHDRLIWLTGDRPAGPQPRLWETQ